MKIGDFVLLIFVTVLFVFWFCMDALK